MAKTDAEGAKTEKPAKAPRAAAPAGETKGRERTRTSFAPDPAPRASEGVPRLRKFYRETVRPRLAREFGLGNAHQIPRLVKVVINVGLGSASKNPRQLEAAVEELSLITGQKPVVTRARKAIANFGLRAGVPVGCSVTLRGDRMYEFLDRFITLSVPRIRDFRGLSGRSFDGRGNYTVGIN